MEENMEEGQTQKGIVMNQFVFCASGLFTYFCFISLHVEKIYTEVMGWENCFPFQFLAILLCATR